jgi:dihydroxyacetone kinase
MVIGGNRAIFILRVHSVVMTRFKSLKSSGLLQKATGPLTPFLSGQAVTGAIALIACTLDHCHIPGRSEYSTILPNTVEIGLVLHNEPVSNFMAIYPESILTRYF